MGLETQDTGGDDGASFKSAPGLAQVMQDEGTNDQNANILNLFLDNTTLQGGAPAPITQFVGTVDVIISSVLFNPNFTRERYGRAAVSDNITLESDRRSLLLDDNQTEEQKTISILGALEFDNGLSAVQSMSDADVTNKPVPDNIDQFSRRPESMYQNAGTLSIAKREHLMSAFTSQAEPEFVDALVSQVGGDSANFSTFGDVVADQTIMQSIASDSVAFAMLSSHPNGTQAMAESQTALGEIAASEPATITVANTPIAVSAIEAASSSGNDSVPITNNANIYIAELAGAGGGGNDNFGGTEGAGSDGGDTTFHQSRAEGGGGGSDRGDGDVGGTNVSNPDVAINESVGSGSSGGTGQIDGDGGDGGFVKSLIVNPDRQSLSLTVGSGGAGGGDGGGDGGDGSATIFTPNAFS